jgi:chorismate synthase
MLRFLDAGESHGKGLVAIIEGIPSNVKIDVVNINNQLSRRQMGYGRGGRMKIERDRVEILSGVRGGKSTGAPIAILIWNKDYENWKEVMSLDAVYKEKVNVPRPGHADLNGVLKYNFDDIRNVIERASARETAIRVAIGAICMELLRNFNVKIMSRVVSIGIIKDESSIYAYDEDIVSRIENSPVRCLDTKIEVEMIEEIERAKAAGDTLGGQTEVIAFNLPVGLGSHVMYDRKLDYKISGAFMSIQGVKAVEIGKGIYASTSVGTEVNDEIFLEDEEYKRLTNFAGGIEGGMTNGMPLIIRAYMKPIPTTKKGLKTVDLLGKNAISRYERSDVCAVPALGVICEAVLAFEITSAILEKFGGDSIEDTKTSYNSYKERIKRG